MTTPPPYPPGPATPATGLHAQYPPPLILPPEPEPPRFNIGVASVITLVICAAAHLVAGVASWLVKPGLAAQDIGSFVFGFLIATAFAWIAWRLDPRRRAGDLVFCFLLVLFSVSRIIGAAHTILLPRRHDTWQQPARQWSPAPARRARSAAQADTAPASPGASPTSADTLREAATRYEGDARKLLEAEARVMDGFHVKQQAFQRALNDLKAVGIVSVHGLDGVDAIARRRALVKNFDAANTDLTEACRTMEGTMRAAMQQAVPGPRAEQGVGWFMEGFHLPLALRIRDCAHREAQAMDNVLVVYMEEYPYWRLGGDNRVAFDHPGVASRQQFWMGQLTAAAQEESTLQQQLVAEQQAMIARRRAANPASSTPPPAAGR